MWRWKRTRTHINGSTHWILTQNGDSKSKNCEKKNQNYGKYVLSFYLNVMCTNFGFQLLFLSLFTSRFSFFFYMPLSFAFAYLSIRITFSCPSLSLSPSLPLVLSFSLPLSSSPEPISASPGFSPHHSLDCEPDNMSPSLAFWLAPCLFSAFARLPFLHAFASHGINNNNQLLSLSLSPCRSLQMYCSIFAVIISIFVLCVKN